MNYPVIAVIVAAGKGRRMKSPVPKQYAILAGKPILSHTLSAFDAAPSIDAVVISADSEETFYRNLGKHGVIEKPLFVTRGGNERQDSVFNALKMIEHCEIVVVHDGVRPLVTASVIEKSVKLARQYGTSVSGMPSKDTIKEIDQNGFAAATLDRSRLWSVQTPQAFRFDLLKEAHIKAEQEAFLGTDDSSLVERLGHRVILFEGGYDNIKITTQEDMLFAEQILLGRGKNL